MPCELLVHFLTMLKKIAMLARSTAISKSASSQTIKGDLPPSSSVTDFKLLCAAAVMMCLPTCVDPVKATYSNQVKFTKECERYRKKERKKDKDNGFY